MHRKVGDTELMAAVQGGRADALRILYDRHAPWLTARLQHRCDDPGAVDEAVQDTFLAVWRRADAFDAGKGSLGAWLWGIAVRRLIDQMRRRSRSATYGRALVESETEESAEDAALVMELGDVGDALNRLSPELQQVLRARVLDGLSTTETAALLQIPEGTVKTRFMRARRELREVVA